MNRVLSDSAKILRRRPIGVFDSGLGGLTVVREIRRRLPSETIVYFGDIARLPYGIKSTEQILNFSIQNTLFLLKHKVKAVVVACNSSSSAAYPFLKDHFGVPIMDVIVPAVEEAVRTTKSGRVGLIATMATVASKAYEKALRKISPRLKIYSQMCSLLVPFVEEGWLKHPITDQVIRHYLLPLCKKKIDTLILGCTHYPLLKEGIQKVMGPSVKLIDSAKPTVQKLMAVLSHHGMLDLSARAGRLEVYVSDMPRSFKKIGERFLGEKLGTVRVVRE